MSRPLFAGSSRGKLSANEKEEKFASNDNTSSVKASRIEYYIEYVLKELQSFFVNSNISPIYLVLKWTSKS